MLNAALRSAERGGPVGRTPLVTRFAFRLAARRRRLHDAQCARQAHAAESSPLGAARVARLLTAWIAAAAVVGALLFGDAVRIHVKAAAGQWLLHRAWAEQQATGMPVKPWPWADTHPIARLIAPETDEDVLVLAGASGRTLAWGPGHLDDSASFGGPGNAVVSAHRDTHFRFLRRVTIGDELVVELPSGARQHYRVRDRYVGDTNDLRLPRTTSVPTLTLVTCYPFDAVLPGGPLRFVVVAEAA